MDQMEQLKEQLEAQNSTLESIEIEKLKLTQQLNENLKEMTLVAKENGFGKNTGGIFVLFNI